MGPNPDRAQVRPHRLILLEDQQLTLVVTTYVVSTANVFLLANVDNSKHDITQVILFLECPASLRKVFVLLTALVAPCRLLLKAGCAPCLK